MKSEVSEITKLRADVILSAKNVPEGVLINANVVRSCFLFKKLCSSEYLWSVNNFYEMHHLELNLA